MLRRFLLAAALAGAAAFGVYWWLTATPIMLAVTEPAYTPNLANGQIIFNAGGCSSCHAVPGQPDRLRLGGGLAIPSPFGTFYAPNISPDAADGIGRWTEAEFVNAVTKGISPQWNALLSGVSLYLLSACEGRRCPRSLRVSEDAAESIRQGARSRRAVSVQHPPQCRHLEIAVHGRQAVHRRCQALGAVELRRLSREQFRSLRGVSQPPQFPRRHRGRAALRRRPQSGRRGLGAEHHAKGVWATGARRTSPIS